MKRTLKQGAALCCCAFVACLSLATTTSWDVEVRTLRTTAVLQPGQTKLALRLTASKFPAWIGVDTDHRLLIRVPRQSPATPPESTDAGVLSANAHLEVECEELRCNDFVFTLERQDAAETLEAETVLQVNFWVSENQEKRLPIALELRKVD